MTIEERLFTGLYAFAALIVAAFALSFVGLLLLVSLA